MKTLLAAALLTILAPSLVLEAGNWPRFRGLNGSGKAPFAEVPLTWSTDENIRWKSDLPGPGSSSPIFWGGRVFVTCYTGYGTGEEGQKPEDLVRHLIALDSASGEEIWRFSHPAPDPFAVDPYSGFLVEHGYASNTPVTDGERIYCFFGKGGVVAVDWDGKLVWEQPVGDLYSQKRWGSASSPILHDGKVIVKSGDEARAVFAFDAETGEKLWTAEGSILEQTYGTPAIHQVSDERADLIVAGTSEIWGMNPDTGKLRWFTETQILGNVSSSPVIEGDQLVIFGGFPRTLGAGITLGLRGDVSDSARLWENVDVKAYMTAPIFHEGHLYFVRDEGIACCADPVKGELIYEERLPNVMGSSGRGKPFYASPILVGDHIFATSRTAGTFVIKAAPEFELVGVNLIEDDGRFQGTPAAAGDQLYLRSETALYAIGAQD
ncbi:MAG: PQQ-binding-like beta-propeller repeat protein [Verrucomicrobiota bacterium]